MLAPGTRLGPYEIQSVVGAGGMGEVYRARDARLDRSVALKVLARETAADPAARARFEREARAVAALDHPHICGIYDVGEANGVHFLIMPLLEGQTLAARLEKGPLPLGQALAIATQIADALDKAHRQGIVHRDLKPANVMLTKAGAGSASSPQAKLLDFGLAKLRGQPGPISMSTMGAGATTSPGTAQGTILGTLQYMAPEQVEGREADARADIWALGAVIYEMVTGTRPFAGDTPASVIGAILKDEPPRISSRQPLSPAALDQLVSGCLAKDPDDRWQSAADVRRQLRWIADSPQQGSLQAGSRVQQRWGAAVLSAVLALLLFGDNVRLRWFGETKRAELVAFTVRPPSGYYLTGASSGSSVATPQLAVSPDGRHLAFVAAGTDGVSWLWLRELNEPEPRRLPGTENPADPFWSPDGTRIAFFGQGALKTVEIAGTDPPTVLARSAIDTRGATWSATHGILWTGAGGGRRLLHLAQGAFPTTSGGGNAVLLNLDGPESQRWPAFLPDGRRFLFMVRDPDPNRRGVYVGSMGSSQTDHLLRSDWNALYASGYLLFVDAQRLMAQPLDLDTRRLTGDPVAIAQPVGASSTGFGTFSVSTTGVLAYAPGLVTPSELVWVDRRGAPSGTLQLSGDFLDFRLSRDDTKLAFSRQDPDTQAGDIWIRDLARGTVSRLTRHPLSDGAPLWSPRDDAIIFRSNRAGPGLELYRAAPNSPDDAPERVYGRPEQLRDIPTHGPESMISTDWSADGRFIIFHTPSNSPSYDIFAIDLSREHGRVRVAAGLANEIHGSLSPDSQRIAFASDESGRYEIYVQEFPEPANKVLVSTNGGAQPRWRQDGLELFYVQADGTLMAVPIRTSPRFDHDPPVPLFKTRLPTTVNPWRWDYVPARDGQRFVMKMPAAGTSETSITVVLNWTALLTK